MSDHHIPPSSQDPPPSPRPTFERKKYRALPMPEQEGCFILADSTSSEGRTYTAQKQIDLYARDYHDFQECLADARLIADLLNGTLRKTIIDECATLIRTQEKGTRYVWESGSHFDTITREIAHRLRCATRESSS